MHNLRPSINALILIIFTTAFAASVQAQNTRSFVSGVGNDANDCLRATPCRTFAGAIVKTAVNGEINCLDPEGYGSVTISKSITIDCEDTQGAILGAFTPGISVNLGAISSTDTMRMVRIRGLTITGQGTGTRGIHVARHATAAPVTLHVDQVVIDGFNEGILFNPSGGQLVVRNTVIQDCSLRGVMIDSGLDSEIVSASLENSSFIHNAEGVRVETRAFVTAANCNISSNAMNGVILEMAENSITEISLYNCVISSNGQSGVSALASVGFGTVRLGGNHIVNNVAAGVFNAAEVRTRGNNTISGNAVDVQGNALVPIPSL